MAKNIMTQGAVSHAGKSLPAAGLCRGFRQGLDMEYVYRILNREV